MRKTALALALSAAATAGAQSSLPAGGSPTGVIPPEMLPPPRASDPSGAKPSAAPAKKEPVERGTVLEEVSGKVADIDLRSHRLRIDTASGSVTLSLDRNTMVYTSSGLGTVLDVVPGAQIRAGRNADFLAYWVQVRATTQAPAPTPGQGGTATPAAGSEPGSGSGSGSGAPPHA